MLAVLLYAVTLRGTFIYDDRFVVERDPRLHSAAGWKAYLTGAYIEDAVDNLWRPATSLTYWAQWQLGLSAEWFFHLVNVLLMAWVCAGVGALGFRMAGGAGGISAAVLFAVHPVHVEGVAYIVGRAETLCSGFLVWGMVMVCAKPLTRRRAPGVFLFGLMALLCKEQGILAPVVFAGAWWVNETQEGRPECLPHRGNWRGSLMLFGLLFLFFWSGYIAYRELILPWYWEVSWLDWTINPVSRSSGWSRWGLPVSLTGRCAAMLVAPLKLSPEYGAAVMMPELSPADPYLWLGMAAVVIWGVGVARAWKRNDQATMFLLLGLGLCWGMVSNVIIIGVGFAERLLFLPSVFFVLAVSVSLGRVRARWLLPVVAVVALLLSARTVAYAVRWNERETFYRISLREQPKSMQLRLLVNEALLEQARVARERDNPQRARELLLESEPLLAEGRALLPGYHRIWSASAQTAYELGQFDQAERFAHRAFDLSPGHPAALYWIQKVQEWRATTQPAQP